MFDSQSSQPTVPASPDFAQQLNLFVDGELPLDQQAGFFAHLADCGDCRTQLDTLLRFRRVIAEERIELPQVVEDQFFKRLALVKRREERSNRSEDRQPLWQTPTVMSVRTAVLAAAAVFVLGMFFSTQAVSNPADMGFVTQEQEQISENPTTYEPPMELPHFYVYPGITVDDYSMVGME